MSKRGKTFVRAFVAFAIVLAFQTAVQATPFLSVDIEATTGSTTQAGFTSWQVAAAARKQIGALLA